MSKTKCNRAKGSYLLELSAVLMGVVTFVLAMYDVATIFRVRGALRAGVDEALRCATRAQGDGGCVIDSKSAGSFNLPERFDVFGYGVRALHSNLSLSAQWQTQRELSVKLSSYRSEDLVGTFSIPRFQQQVKELRFNTNATISYLVETVAPPYLTGNSLNPTVSSLRNHRQRLDPRVVVPIRGAIHRVTGRSRNDDSAYDENNEIKAARTKFTVGAVVQGDGALLSRAATLPCFQPIASRLSGNQLVQSGTELRIDWSQSSTIEYCSQSNKSTGLSPDTEFRVPVAIHITGFGATSSDSDMGQVVVQMEWNERGQLRTRELGGRVFSGGVVTQDNTERINDNGTLIFRGVPKHHMDDSTYQEYPREVALHSDAPRLKAGTEVTLRFFLRKFEGVDASSVSWRGADVEVFYPTYSAVAETVYSSQLAVPANCQRSAAELKAIKFPPYIGSMIKCEVPQGTTARRETISHGECQSETRTYAPSRGLSTEAESRILSQVISNVSSVGSAVQFSEDLHDESICPTQVVQERCSSGETVELYSSCLNEEGSSNSLNRCASQSGVSLQPLSVQVAAAAQVLSERTVRVRECDNERPPQCALNRAIQSAEVIFPQSGQPAQCEKAASKSFSPKTSAATSPMTVSMCEALKDRVIQKEREVGSVPAEIQFSAVCSQPEMTYFRTKPITNLPFEVARDVEPILIGRALPIGSASRLCLSSEGAVYGACEVVKAPTTSIQSGDGLTEIGSINIPQVELIALNTIQAMYPALERCELSRGSCIRFEVKGIPSSPGNLAERNRVAMVAKATPQLTLLHHLNPSLSELSFRDERVSEER